jgi:hypothetical protein
MSGIFAPPGRNSSPEVWRGSGVLARDCRLGAKDASTDQMFQIPANP